MAEYFKSDWDRLASTFYTEMPAERLHPRVGWRREQLRNYEYYIQPVICSKKLIKISPQLVARVLNEMAKKGKSEQT